MRLQGSDGQAFELTIAGYEFPDACDDSDEDWLMVEGRVTHPEGAWTFRDPCLMTFEVEKLAKWLETLTGAGHAPATSPWFTEPNLRFSDVRVAGEARLRITFWLESLPSWATPPAVAKHRELYVEFPYADIDLAEAAADLRAQLAAFLER